MMDDIRPPRPIPLGPPLARPPQPYGPELEKTVLMISDKEPVGGPTHHDGRRIVWPWQNRILCVLLDRLKAGDPTAEPSILWLRNLWGFDEAATRAALAEWKTDWRTERERAAADRRAKRKRSPGRKPADPR